MDGRKVLLACTVVFSILLEIYVRSYGIYGSWNPIDNFIHFFWGFNVFLFIVLFMRWRPIDALLLVLATHWLWEAGEIFFDNIIEQERYMLDPFFFDGIKDTIVNAIGALAGWATLRLLGMPDTKASSLYLWATLYSAGMIPLIIVGSFVSLIKGSSAQWLAFGWILAMIPAAALYVHWAARPTFSPAN